MYFLSQFSFHSVGHIPLILGDVKAKNFQMPDDDWSHHPSGQDGYEPDDNLSMEQGMLMQALFKCNQA